MARRKTEPLPNAPALYLLHLEAPVGGHAAHYLGECENLAARIRSHRRGAGARLLATATARGIGWRLVRTWAAPADKAARLQLERRLKNAHGPRLCPVCNPHAHRLGTLTVGRVAAVKWPRPRRYGRFLDDAPGPPSAPAPPRRGEPVTLPVPLWAAA
jgi:predicted GIY-YIG superfamily endonuclease